MKEKIGISEGILLGIVSILGYACTYYFEVGYKGYYHIPGDYIEIGVINVIKSVSYIILVFTFIFGVINTFMASMPKIKKNILQDDALRGSLIMAAAMFLVVLFNKFELSSLIASIVTVVIVYLNIKYRKKDTSAFSNPYAPVSLVGTYYGFKGLVTMYFILLTIAILPNIATVGQYAARNQTDYLVMKSPTDMVVLGTYKDNIIIAEVDLKKHLIKSKFKFIKSENLQAEMIKTGRLKVSVTSSVY